MRPAAPSGALPQPELATGVPVALSRAALLKGGMVLAAGSTALALPQPPSWAAEGPSWAAEAALAPPAAAAAGPPGLPQTVSSVVLRTLADCQLAVSIYPTFSYNAAGGGGAGWAELRPDGLLHVAFDPASLRVPAIDTQHASILGVPLPPPLRIDIQPQQLRCSPPAPGGYSWWPALQLQPLPLAPCTPPLHNRLVEAWGRPDTCTCPCPTTYCVGPAQTLSSHLCCLHAATADTLTTAAPAAAAVVCCPPSAAAAAPSTQPPGSRTSSSWPALTSVLGPSTGRPASS